MSFYCIHRHLKETAKEEDKDLVEDTLSTNNTTGEEVFTNTPGAELQEGEKTNFSCSNTANEIKTLEDAVGGSDQR